MMNFRKSVRFGALSALFLLWCSLALAQPLSVTEVNQIAQSLQDQQLLSQKGKDELIRFSEKKPLQVYKNISEKNYGDDLPGRNIFPPAHFDTLLNKIKDFEKGYELKEQRYLAGSFPNRSDLFNFIHAAAAYYRDEQSGSEATKKLTEGFGEYFGPAIKPLLSDSTVEFQVSAFEDTRVQQEERVKQAKPYLIWLDLFKKTGLLDAQDMRMEHYYGNGNNIISSVSHRKMMDDIGKLIIYHDKFPYYKQQQLALLDSFTATGFIDPAARKKLIDNYSRDTLLNINDLALHTKNYLSFDYEKEIEPLDFITREYYGQIPTDKIKKLYELVLQKAAALLNFRYTDLEVHVVKDEIQAEVPGNRQFYIYVKINDILYKEMIKERDLESWINAPNFQFLNHYLEDQLDPRRFYFTTAALFTGYEANYPKTIFLTLLKEKEAELVRNVYLASKSDVCYNGSPGDYSYAVWEYYDLNERLTRTKIADVVDFFLAEQILKKTEKKSREQLVAAWRERNPVSLSNMLLELPNAFTSGLSNTVEGFLYDLNTRLKELQTADQDYLTDYAHSRIPVNGQPDQEKLLLTFQCGQKKYELELATEEQAWENNKLINIINEALTEAKIPYGVYPLPEDSSYFRQDLHGDNYILIAPEQAAKLISKYGDLFKKKSEGQE